MTVANAIKNSYALNYRYSLAFIYFIIIKSNEMKILILGFVLLVTGSNAFHAQCEKKVTLISSKTEYLDGSGVLQNTISEKTIIEITKSEITVTPGEDASATGTIKSDSCNWKVPFKEGKTIIKAVMTDEGGDIKHVTFTIEGKDGKITLLADVEELINRKIRLTADTFREKK